MHRHLIDIALNIRMCDDTTVAGVLRDGCLTGAVPDVFEGEPVGAANPFVCITNLIVIPHIVSVNQGLNVHVSAVAAENVKRALSAV
jgi:phosphoglycerate dehydrogenase-like enzyme